MFSRKGSEKKKKRREERQKRQIKVDFSSEEALQNFKEKADEWGVSYSQLMELLAEYGTDAILNGDLNLSEFLTESKLPWLRDWDIDVDRYRQKRKRKNK